MRNRKYMGVSMRSKNVITMFIILFTWCSIGSVAADNLYTDNNDMSDMFGDLHSTNLTNESDSTSSLKDAFDKIKGGSSGEAALLTHNANAWAARWWMLKQASSTIDTTYFIVEQDVFGMSFLGHLLVKGKEGCKIRFMIDTKGSVKLTTSIFGQDYLQELEDNGNAQVVIYGPADKSIGTYIGETVKRVFTGDEASSAVAACNHDKIICIDNSLSMTGGRNIAHHYFAPFADSPDVFRDTDIMFKSEKITEEFRKAFLAEYKGRRNRKVHKEMPGFNVRRDVELTAAYIMMNTWLYASKLDDSTITDMLKSSEAREPYVKELMKAVKDELPKLGYKRNANNWDKKNYGVWAEELTRYPRLRGAGEFDPSSKFVSVEKIKVIDKGSSLNKIEDVIQKALTILTSNATESILIQNPYVVLTKPIVSALAAAAKRGVQITIVTNSPVSTDSKETQGFFLDKWPLYQAAIPNLKLKVLTGTRKLHAKTAIFDDVVSLVGTYNLDFMSAAVNSEIISVMWSESFASLLKETILNDPSYAADLYEYKIKLDSNGNPVDKDPSTSKIEPVIDQGPKDHVPPEILEEYKKVRKRTRAMEKHLPQLETLY